MEKNFNPDERVFFIRRCNENTALSSAVETGIYIDDMPGWIFDKHVRIVPDGEEKTISVPVSRVWFYTEDGKNEAIEFVTSLIKRQSQSLKFQQERLAASEWKLNQLNEIYKNITNYSL